jgi:hypothetical protein
MTPGQAGGLQPIDTPQVLGAEAPQRQGTATLAYRPCPGEQAYQHKLPSLRGTSAADVVPPVVPRKPGTALRWRSSSMEARYALI